VSGFEPRVTAVRADLAAADLEGRVAAPRYAAPVPMRCAAPAVAVRKIADRAAEQQDQLLFGERFDVLDEAGGWAWGQARRDGYVGWVPREALAAAEAAPTHWVHALRTYAFAAPDIKSPARGPYSINALVSVEAREGRFVRDVDGGWFVEAHLSPIGLYADDAAAVAEQHLGAPYLWGGRDSRGLDCSGLVQQALLACGRSCPRDADMQQAAFAAPTSVEALRRGDLVFWRGHVAMLVDAERIIHANAHHMAVAVEPLAEARSRIAAAGGGEPTAFARP